MSYARRPPPLACTFTQTNCLSRFCRNEFLSNSKPTIGTCHTCSILIAEEHSGGGSQRPARERSALHALLTLSPCACLEQAWSLPQSS